MKIAVLVPSRGREQSLRTVLGSLFYLQSGQHEVEYVVLSDEDDVGTKAAVQSLTGINVRIEMAPRKLVPVRVNAWIKDSDADVFMQWADDLIPLAAEWDDITANLFEKSKVPAFSWQEVQDPKNHTCIVLSKEWVKATGRFYPEHFPFWFGDTWMKEIFLMAFHQEMPIVEYLRFSHKREATMQMRDLAFWFRVFARTREERVEEAKVIAKAYGRAWRDVPELMDLFRLADKLQLDKVPQFEAAFGANRGEPSALYLEAKYKAECLFKVETVFGEAA